MTGYFHFTFPRNSGHPPPEARDTPLANLPKSSCPHLSTQQERLHCQNKCCAIGNLQCARKCCKVCCISRYGGVDCPVLNHTPGALTSNLLDLLSSLFVRDHLPSATMSGLGTTSSRQRDEATLALHCATWACATDTEINNLGFSYKALFCTPPVHPHQLGACLNGLDVDPNGLSDSDLVRVEDKPVLKAIERVVNTHALLLVNRNDFPDIRPSGSSGVFGFVSNVAVRPAFRWPSPTQREPDRKPKEAARFFSNFVKRTQLTSKLLECGASAETVRAQHILLKKFYESRQNSTVIEAALLEHASLRHRMLELNAFGLRPTGLSVLFMAFLFVHSTASSHHQIRSAAQLVEGGFVSLFFSGLQAKGWEPQKARSATLTMLRFLGTMSCYPRFMDAFLPAITSLPATPLTVFNEQNQELIDNWHLFLPMFRRRCALYKAFQQSSGETCNNFDHFDRQRDSLSRVKLKTGPSDTTMSAHLWRTSI
ncbi:hypothetical protein BKA70DRAFT_1435410 [Coprinopsis sp. MPI-PUGE-AT-0042]|nr:hypothetical protein BKA70DRAFT_1435410 [Coprinopsis sp. MPI-PUGE-AT-0042]